MFDNCMYEQIKRLQDELKACAVSVLVDNGYDNEKAKKSVECIKNFNIYETVTGYRVDTLVDDYKISVFHHKYETRVQTMYKKLFDNDNTISDNDKSISDRFQKLENWVSSLDDTRTQLDDLKESYNQTDVKLKFIGENLLSDSTSNLKDEVIKEVKRQLNKNPL